MKKLEKSAFLASLMALLLVLGTSFSLPSWAKGGSDSGGSSSKSSSGNDSNDDGGSSKTRTRTREGSSGSNRGSGSAVNNSGPGSVNSGRALENGAQGGGGNEGELRGRANEGELNRGENRDKIEIEIENEKLNNEIEIQGQDGARVKVRLQTKDSISHRSAVAEAVKGLLEASRNLASGEDRGIGEEVRLIAQSQNDSRKKVAVSLDKIEAKGRVAKFFFGPDFAGIENVKKEINANNERIVKLKNIEAEVGDAGIKAQIGEQFRALEKENENLKTDVEVAENTTSLFGWLMRRLQ